MTRPERAPLVLIAWVDASAVTERWMDRREAIKAGIRYSGDPILACGFLIAERKDVVVRDIPYDVIEEVDRIEALAALLPTQASDSKEKTT